MLLISVHMPKTAGTSFRLALEGECGDSLESDYVDLPVNTPRPNRELMAMNFAFQSIRRRPFRATTHCIHGHFLPLKYRFVGRWVSEVKFITWLRDPVERLASHYRFWRGFDVSDNVPALHRRMLEENWSLDRFCLGPELRNLYVQLLFGFPVKRFSFIGLVERSDEDFERFRNNVFSGSDISLPESNVGEGGVQHRHITDGKFRRKVEQYHAKDVALYRAVRDRQLAFCQMKP